MTLFLEGEKRLWKGGLVGATTYLALFGAEGWAAASELSAAGGAAYEAANYARVAVASAGWTISASTGAARNAARIAFAAPGAGAEWPGVVAAALYDAQAGGNLLIGVVLPGAPLVASGADNPIDFGIGQLILDV